MQFFFFFLQLFLAVSQREFTKKGLLGLWDSILYSYCGVIYQKIKELHNEGGHWCCANGEENFVAWVRKKISARKEKTIFFNF